MATISRTGGEKNWHTDMPSEHNGQGLPFPLDSLTVPPELVRLLVGPPKKTMVTDDDIQRHEGSAILLPTDMGLETARDIVAAKITEQDEEHVFSRCFDYRPEDGAHATADVLARMFGIVVGAKTPGDGPFAPPTPPQYITVATAHNATREVPWGALKIPSLPGATLVLGRVKGPLGPLFLVEVTAPKKHKVPIEELFDAIAAELQTASIYRGHALEGAHSLTFLDTSRFDPARLIFSEQVETTLDAALWTVLRHPEAVRKAGLPLRRSVLLYGTWGTGKTSIGQKTAQLCEQTGWTFLLAKAGKDDLAAVLQTAALYQRAVVFVEDIDRHIPKAADRDAVSEILDLFDGFTAKGREVLLIATTNRVETIPAAVLRPGRMDYVIPIEGLDRSAAERIIQANVPAALLGDVDYDEVFAHMTAFQPAFGRAVADRALSVALARTDGGSFYLTTADFVAAADSLQVQLAMMQAASDGEYDADLDTALRSAVQAAVNGVEVYDCDYGPGGPTAYALRPPRT